MKVNIISIMALSNSNYIRLSPCIQLCLKSLIAVTTMVLRVPLSPLAATSCSCTASSLSTRSLRLREQASGLTC